MNDFREFSIQYNNYLMHHGVLGMHWGIRRYQNPDGSLTPEGMKKYRGKFKREYMEDARMLYSHQRNEQLKSARNITNPEEQKTKNRQAKQQYKEAIKNAKESLKKLADNKELYDKYSKMKNQSIKELGAKYNTIRNINKVNNALSALQKIGTGISGVSTGAYLGMVLATSAAAPLASPIAIGAGVSTLAGTGISLAINQLDKKIRRNIINAFA